MNFTPLRDLVLVRPDPKALKDGSIFFPDGATQDGHQAGEKVGAYHDSFIGTVVAVGPGDKKLPFDRNKCWKCGKPRVLNFCGFFECGCEETTPHRLDADEREWNSQGDRYPMYLKVGDRVIYPRRPSAPGGDCDVMLDGELHVMFHEQQFALAVVEA